MSNPTTPFGFRPVRQINGSSFNDAVNEYYHASGDGAAIYIGDAVITNHTANTDIQTTPVVTVATSTGAVRGAMVGARPTLSNLTLQYAAASVGQYVLVADSPWTIFQVMMNGTGTAQKVSGQNAAIDYTLSGSTNTGLSGQQVSATTATTDATVRILRLAPTTNNLLGASNVVEALFNDHELKSTTGT